MATMISRVARVNSSHPYLENAPSSWLVSHRLRISPWLRFRLLQFIKDGDMAHANHNSLVQANSVLSRTQAQGLRLPSTTVALLTSVVKAVVGSDIAGLGPDGIVSTETRTI